MITKRMTFLLLVLFPLSGLLAQVAQTEPAYRENRKMSEKRKAERAINSLDGSVLIVRLPSHAKKIAALEERLETGSEDNQNLYYRQLLENAEKDRTEFALHLMGAFEAEYNFSEVYFVWDTVTLSREVMSGVFLNDYLEVDPEVSVDLQQSHLLAFSGNTDPQRGAGIEALILCDANMNRLQAPFPYYVPYNYGLSSLRMLLFGASRAGILKRSVRRWNVDLHEYREKTEEE